jgi:hypothetical protein
MVYAVKYYARLPVIGVHLRRIYELAAYYGLTNRADLYAAAAVSDTAGDEAVTALEIAGLLTRTGRGTVGTGTTTLDSLTSPCTAVSIRHATLTADQKALLRASAI